MDAGYPQSVERVLRLWLRCGNAELRDALGVASETASIAPTRWRSRAPLAQYLDGAVHIDRALRNARVLARRSVAMLDENEPLPADLLGALRAVAGAVVARQQEWAAGRDPRRTRHQALTAVGEAADAYRAGLGFSGDVVVAQIRSIASDLLRASRTDEGTSTRAVRRAVGRLAA